MRSFQWRWECTGKNLMETTADALKKMWEKVAVALFEAEVMEGLSVVIPKVDGAFFW
jgi:hypothetical protein